MKILLAEDVRAVAALMAARLTSLGHEVVLAGNGKIAVEQFRQTAPDLVLMDIEMPVMSGFQASSQIRAIEATQQWAWTPIIFLTASDTIENLITAIEAGGDDFMAKTVPEPVLNAKMKAFSRIATLRQRLAFANQALQEIANRDGLTGLCNRRSMDLRIDLAWNEALEHATPFGLLMLDIDNFKKFNDHYGHQSGDDCLRAVAHSIAATVDQSCDKGLVQNAFTARYGGEEFAVVLPGVSFQAYQSIAQAIVDDVRRLGIPHEKNEGKQVVTVSVGGHHLEPARGELIALFRQADERLYRAKSNGRDRAETV